MWLSYIIPLYNCEQYILRCLESITRQGLASDEYEVVVINDGSTDKSREIVEDFCLTHNNFSVYSQQNAGVGAARNAGVLQAKGDFIMFVDADDWLLDDGMSILKGYIDFTQPRDMYTFWSHTVDSHYDEVEWGKVKPHKVLYDGDFRGYVERYGFGWSVWSRLMSRQMIIDSGVKFGAYKVAEDVLFMVQLFTSTNSKIMATSVNIYRYFVNNKSSVNSCDIAHNRNAFMGYLEIYGIVLRLAETKNYSQHVFDEVIRDCQYKAFTRLISAADSLDSVKYLKKQAFEAKILPVKSKIKGKADKYINFFLKNNFLLLALSLFYQRLFLPYIKPRLGRN